MSTHKTTPVRKVNTPAASLGRGLTATKRLDFPPSSEKAGTVGGEVSQDYVDLLGKRIVDAGRDGFPPSSDASGPVSPECGLGEPLRREQRDVR